jgi:nucleotide-binding universal stress UspA family protein
MFRRILVGFDGSRPARVAIRSALAVAESSSGEVTVLITVPATHGETEEDRRAAFEADSSHIRAIADTEIAAARSAARCNVKAVAGDHPARVLADYVAEHGYDLLVVGRHGRERASHGGPGRVARQLVDNSPCPLLLVGDEGPGVP